MSTEALARASEPLALESKKWNGDGTADIAGLSVSITEERISESMAKQVAFAGGARNWYATEIDFSAEPSPYAPIEVALPPDGGDVTIPPGSSTRRPSEQIESELNEFLRNLPPDASEQEMKDAAETATGLIKEQEENTNQAFLKLFQADGVDELLDLAWQDAQNVFDVLPENFRLDESTIRDMELLAALVFAGQDEKAQEIIDQLALGAPEAATALEEHLDILKQMAEGNKELLDQNAMRFIPFVDAYNAEERMIDAVDEHPLGKFMQFMD